MSARDTGIDLYGMTPEELLSKCGPSWSVMTSEQRERYGAAAPVELTTTLDAIGDLIELAMAHPRGIAAEGLEATAWRWGEPAAVCQLARALDRDTATLVLVEEQPARRTSKPAAWERDLAFARRGAA